MALYTYYSAVQVNNYNNNYGKIMSISCQNTVCCYLGDGQQFYHCLYMYKCTSHTFPCGSTDNYMTIVDNIVPIFDFQALLIKLNAKLDYCLTYSTLLTLFTGSINILMCMMIFIYRYSLYYLLSLKRL